VNYFVAEDVVHIRLSDPSKYVSACGYEYPPSAVDWADEFEPEAWPACEDCMSAQTQPGSRSADVVVVQGAYALDEAHLLVGRDGNSWLSLCGRCDDNDAVVWAGPDWPEAYEQCPECVAIVDAHPYSSEQSDHAAEAERPASTSLAARIREYRLWIVATDGIEHRPSDESLTRAMCGAGLQPGDVQRTKPVGGSAHCHTCDRAVGEARAARRPRRPRSTAKRTSVRPIRKTGKRAQGAKKGRRRTPTGTDKEIALFGRRMIVPVRFVHAGLPGLGKRR
jgi:hypothetical protein